MEFHCNDRSHRNARFHRSRGVTPGVVHFGGGPDMDELRDGEMIEVRLPSLSTHSCHTAVTLLLYCCYTVVTFNSCYITFVLHYYTLFLH
jgi:hypothetical protein